IQDNAGAGIKFPKISSSVDATASSNFKVFGNSFAGNADGAIFINTAEGSRYTGTLDASGDWWGAASGPDVASVRFAGPGQARTDTTGPNDRVDFTPWLNSGVDTDLGTPGFQGSFSSLDVSPLSP